MKAPNGKRIIGTIEHLQAVARLRENATAEDWWKAYEGTTDVDWDSQYSVTDEQGLVTFVDEDGQFWGELAVTGLPPSQFIEGRFSLADTSYPGLERQGYYWNGFSVPYFTLDTMRAIAADLQRSVGRPSGVKIQDDQPLFDVGADPDKPAWEARAPVLIGGVPHWTFDGWCWTRDEPERHVYRRDGAFRVCTIHDVVLYGDEECAEGAREVGP